MEPETGTTGAPDNRGKILNPPELSRSGTFTRFGPAENGASHSAPATQYASTSSESSPNNHSTSSKMSADSSQSAPGKRSYRRKTGGARSSTHSPGYHKSQPNLTSALSRAELAYYERMSSKGKQHASSCALEKKDREDRMRMIKERQQLEQERKEAALKEAGEKERKRMENMEKERLEKIRKIKEREEQRQKAVHDKRRHMEEVEHEKKQAMVAKYRAQSENRMGLRDRNKPVYAFGSSTPRVLAYLENLPGDQRVYDKKLVSEPLTKEELDQLTLSSTLMNGSFTMGASNRAASAVGFPNNRRGYTGNDSIDGTPSRSIRNKSNSMSTSSSAGPSPASSSQPRGRSTLRTSPRNRHLQVAAGVTANGSDVMTQSFTAGDSGGKAQPNPRRKAPLPRRPASMAAKPGTPISSHQRQAGSQPNKDGETTVGRQRSGPPNTAQTRRMPAALAQRAIAARETRKTVPGETDGNESTNSPKPTANQRRSNQTATPAAANKRRPVSSSVPPTSGRKVTTSAASVAEQKEDKSKPIPRRPLLPTSSHLKEAKKSVNGTGKVEPKAGESMSPSPPGTPPDQKRLKSELPPQIAESPVSTPGSAQSDRSPLVSPGEHSSPEQHMDVDLHRDSDSSSSDQMLVVESTEILKESMDVRVDKSEIPEVQVNNLLIDFGEASDDSKPTARVEPLKTESEDFIREPEPVQYHKDNERKSSFDPFSISDSDSAPFEQNSNIDDDVTKSATSKDFDLAAEILPSAPQELESPKSSLDRTVSPEKEFEVDDPKETELVPIGESFADQLLSSAGEKERVMTEQNEAAAKAALMEQRRIARELKEIEMEKQRQIEEEEKRKEEEGIRLEEEEFRRQEQEELRLLEEVKRAEEERLRKAIEEEDKRKEEERKAKEEEEKKRQEEEEKQRIDRERLEREQLEKEEKFRKEQEEREERKKKLSAIMARTRNSPNPNASPSVNAAPASVAVTTATTELRAPSPLLSGGVNGVSGGQNGTPLLSVSSASVLQKLAGSSPVIGNILSRHRSNPSLADPVSSTPKSSNPVINGDKPVPRMTMSMMEHGSSLDSADVHGDRDIMSTRTLYDLDPMESESMSRSAIVFSNAPGPVDANANSLFDELIESGVTSAKGPVPSDIQTDALKDDFWAVNSVSTESMGTNESSSPTTAIFNGPSQGSSLFRSKNEWVDFGEEISQERPENGNLTNGHLSSNAN